MSDKDMWEKAVTAVAGEYAALSPSLRAVVGEGAAAVRGHKMALNALSQGVGGSAICADCRGECCARGRHHFTVIDLLVHLSAGQLLPTPDFAADCCPWLGPAGCLMEPGYRPFNCVTFNCDLVEGLLDAPVLERFYRTERELRDACRELEELLGNRFMQGLLLSYERAVACGSIVLKVRNTVHDAA